MSKYKHDLLLRLMKLLNVVCLAMPFAWCWYRYYASRIVSPFHAVGDLLVVALFCMLYVLLGRIYGAFMVSMQSVLKTVYAQFWAVGITDIILYVVICLLSHTASNLLPGLAAFGAQMLLSYIWAFFTRKGYYAMFPAKKTAIVFNVRRGVEKLIDNYGLKGNYEVVLILSIEECLKDLSILNGIEVVFASGVQSHDRNILLKFCIEHDIMMYMIPRIGDVIMSGAQRMHMFHLPVLCIGRYMARPEYLFLKRVIDIVVSIMALILLSPIFLLTAIAIKLEDKGPVLYRQVRLTKNGRSFEILKFRSMRVDAEKDGIARLSTGDKDARITRVGRFIRLSHIDELPQLLNILKGDLSLVGPRPERPEIAAQYCKEIPEFHLRLQAKAGLTGYAQIYGKYNTTPYDKLVMDLMYIAHPSIIEDMKIVFGTIKILFLPESSEGVAEGQITAMDEEEADAFHRSKGKGMK